MNTKAFTLIEVMIALAVVSFCVVILMGLFASGMISGLKSTDNTNLAAVTWDVANELRTNSSTSGVSAGYIEWYEADGQFISQSASAPPNAYYKCQIYSPSTPSWTGSPSNLQLRQVVISYPASTVLSHSYTNFVLVSPNY